MNENLVSRIKAAMDEHGVTAPGWRIKVSEVNQVSSSDWATVVVDVLKPRCRKPCSTWELAIWVPGMLLRWDLSKFVNR